MSGPEQTEERATFCALCLTPADEAELTKQLPDGCRAHERCWLIADYEEVKRHHEARGGTS